MVTLMSKSSNWSWIIRLLLLVTMVTLMAKSVSAITCQEAILTLVPCSGYLKGKGRRPTYGCCERCHHLDQQCHTKEERKAPCECLMETGPKVRVDPERAKRLPGLCKLKLPFPITPEIDCDKTDG